MILISIVLLGIVIAVVAVSLYTKSRMNAVNRMSSLEMIAYTTSGKRSKNGGGSCGALISVGIIQNGKTSFTLYGENGTVLPFTEHIYEIGSITKTVTCSLLCKAVTEGLISLDSPLSTYIELPADAHNPTIRQIATHTAGYKSAYINRQMIANAFEPGVFNSFYAISGNDILEQARHVHIADKNYPFKYSNFGMGLMGEILSHIYGKSYTQIANDFLQNELNLTHTYVADETSLHGDLENYWQWKQNDAYKSAGAVVSTITDSTHYIQQHMEERVPYLAIGHTAWTDSNPTFVPRELYGVHIDTVGAAWILDNTHRNIWHNGGTSCFNSHAAFDHNSGTAVVVLSNTAPSYRIPATLIGIKLMDELRAHH